MRFKYWSWIKYLLNENLDRKNTKVFYFMTFHTKLWWMQNHCVLGSIKIKGFIKIYKGIRCLVLHDYERYNAIDDRIRYLISEKSGTKNSKK